MKRKQGLRGVQETELECSVDDILGKRSGRTFDAEFVAFMMFLSGTVMAALARYEFLRYIGLGLAITGLIVGFKHSKLKKDLLRVPERGWAECKKPKWFNARVLEKKMPQVYFFGGKHNKYKAVLLLGQRQGEWEYIYYCKPRRAA